ncbi:hypothetical protein LTR39_003301, partial [Cryomyces antarcticus]
MTSKFFTWTKGDRHNAAEALRTRGLASWESLPASSLDGAKKTAPKKLSKLNRKPKPLTLVPTQDCDTYPYSLTPNSAVLHDAAVSSMTNLLAVVNDVMRSPRVSAATRSPFLKPLPGRPRSHTAPPTPLYECGATEIAELPGSLLLENQGYPMRCRTSWTRVAVEPEKTPPGACSSLGLQRPHTSPHENRDGSLQHDNSLEEHDALVTESATANVDHLSPLSRGSGIRRRTEDYTRPRTSRTSSNESQKHRQNDQKLARPLLGVSQSCPSQQPPSEGVRGDSDPKFLQVKAPSDQIDELRATINARDQTISMLSAQFMNLRTSQEAHIASLKDTHAKELASIKTYTEILEESHHSSQDSGQDLGRLTLDTTYTSDNLSHHRMTDLSAVSSCSSQTALENAKRSSQESAAEIEALGQSKSKSLEHNAEFKALYRERNHARKTLEATEHRLCAVAHNLSRVQQSEKALRDKAESLGERLEAANAQKTDVLEANHKLREKLEKSEDRERALREKIELSRCQPNKPAMKLVQDKDAPQMAAAVPLKLVDANKACNLETPDLWCQIASYEKTIQSLRAQRDQTTQLLHAEIRKRASSLSAREHLATLPRATTADIDRTVAETRAHVSGMLATRSSSTYSHDDQSSGQQARIEQLEQEIAQHVRDIVLYKLDVKGYKKDLQRATATIQRLQALAPVSSATSPS